MSFWARGGFRSFVHVGAPPSFSVTLSRSCSSWRKIMSLGQACMTSSLVWVGVIISWSSHNKTVLSIWYLCVLKRWPFSADELTLTHRLIRPAILPPIINFFRCTFFPVSFFLPLFLAHNLKKNNNSSSQQRERKKDCMTQKNVCLGDPAIIQNGVRCCIRPLYNTVTVCMTSGERESRLSRKIHFKVTFLLE